MEQGKEIVSKSEIIDEKVELIKRTVCKGATDDEFKLFMHVCERTGLDPFVRQIYSIPRGGQRTIQTGIDGLRLIAERTEKYSPGKESSFIFDENGNLKSATSYVKKMTKDGTWHEVAATAAFSEYKPGNNNFWMKMPQLMLAKCAEALALRKAFPAEMCGLYIKEEMDQADQDNEGMKEIEIAKKDIKAEKEKLRIQKEQDVTVEKFLSTLNGSRGQIEKWMNHLIKTNVYPNMFNIVVDCQIKKAEMETAFQTWQKDNPKT